MGDKSFVSINEPAPSVLFAIVFMVTSGEKMNLYYALISPGTWIDRWSETTPDKVAIIDEDLSFYIQIIRQSWNHPLLIKVAIIDEGLSFRYRQFSDRIKALSGLVLNQETGWAYSLITALNIWVTRDS